MKKGMVQRVLGRRLARQLDSNGLDAVHAGTSYYVTVGLSGSPNDAVAADCSEHDTFTP